MAVFAVMIAENWTVRFHAPPSSAHLLLAFH